MNKPVAYVNSMCSDYIDWKVDPMSIDGQSLYTTPQTKPLSNDEIHELANEHLRTQNQDGHLVVLGMEDFARAIEEAHGIK